MKYYIIAGEASGDLHASNLICELKKLDHQAYFRCWGGDLMLSQGAEIVKHYKELAFMGFLEVVANLKTILKNIEFCKKDILENRPDILILVDYPGFNLRIAEFAHSNGIKVVYYISPQVWAWKQSRVLKIKKNVDQMLVILPFEKDFYQKFDYKVDFVGHPLLDAINMNARLDATFKKNNLLNEKKIIALLPGSRKQEIAIMLPMMLQAVAVFKDYQIAVAGAPSVPVTFYKQYLKEQYPLIQNETYELLKHSHVALVTSGTATLETALFDVPQIVCYKGNLFSYYIARQLIKVKFISLVNLIMDKIVVKELIQADLSIAKIRKELGFLLKDEAYRKKISDNYQELKQKLGGSGASRRAAKIIYELPP